VEPCNRLSFEKRLEIKEKSNVFKEIKRNQRDSNVFQMAEFSPSVLLITCHHDLTGPILAQQVQTRS
jgi:hypothetical protein